jgi:hypothetical protein
VSDAVTARFSGAALRAALTCLKASIDLNLLSQLLKPDCTYEDHVMTLENEVVFSLPCIAVLIGRLEGVSSVPVWAVPPCSICWRSAALVWRC